MVANTRPINIVGETSTKSRELSTSTRRMIAAIGLGTINDFPAP